MTEDHDLIDANVLTIGGGVAGSLAALRASELTDNVVLVDKAYVSRGGASTMAGGITTFPTESDDFDAWAHEFIIVSSSCRTRPAAQAAHRFRPSWRRDRVADRREPGQ